MKRDIYRTLRIIFCLLAAALCAVTIFVFVYFDWWWGVLCVICAAACTFLMLLFKRLQNDCEPKENTPSVGDFITGPKDDNRE